eukprot:jgi/Galph1/3493/GphlegSOOS_G2137.1
MQQHSYACFILPLSVPFICQRNKSIRYSRKYFRLARTYELSGCCQSTQSAVNNTEEAYIRRAIDLAKIATGKTRPNPLVGCVIVSSKGKVVGEGYHPKAGMPHAEIYALRQAGEEAKGATLYVNLEPCAHSGRTPPCVDAIIQAGITKVVIGMVDPDPRTKGKGINRLISHGIQVLVGLEESTCRYLNEGFIYRIRRKVPLGIYKYAMSLDGRIATGNGDSKWISNEKSREMVHYLRSQVDAIVVGGETVRKDDPQLTVRLAHRQDQEERLCWQNEELDRINLQPLRIVVTGSMNVPVEARIFDHQETNPTVIITKKNTQEEQKKHILRNKGIEIVEVDTDILSTKHIMQYLYEKDALQVLWECGSRLASCALKEGYIQKVIAFITPKIVGGNRSPSPFASLDITKMEQAIPLKVFRTCAIQNDWMLEGYLPDAYSVIYESLIE